MLRLQGDNQLPDSDSDDENTSFIDIAIKFNIFVYSD
jgi:hypothetical protein